MLCIQKDFEHGFVSILGSPFFCLTTNFDITKLNGKILDIK